MVFDSQILSRRTVQDYGGLDLDVAFYSGHDKQGVVRRKRQTRHGLVRSVLAAQ
jgi:hypothetical protein